MSFPPLFRSLDLDSLSLSLKDQENDKATPHLARVGPARVRRHGAQHWVPLLRPVEPGGRDSCCRLSRGRGLKGGGGRGDGRGCAAREKRTGSKRRRVCFLRRRSRWRCELEVLGAASRDKRQATTSKARRSHAAELWTRCARVGEALHGRE